MTAVQQARPTRPVIPLVDLFAQYQAIAAEIQAAIAGVIHDSAFIKGRYVAAFERELAAFCGTADAVGTSNGTDALALALRACGIGPGDEVITVPNTFIATAEAIVHVGARPVFVDVDPATHTLDPAGLEAALTPRTRAVLPVHLFGQMADMPPIVAFARRHGLRLIEDAAQAIGARFQGLGPGHWGDAACFSFYPGKNLGAYGDAGAVVTQDVELGQRVRMLGDNGRQDKYLHELIGYGNRLDGLQAAILSVKLRHLPAWTRRRQALAATYRQALADVPEIRFVSTRPESEPVYHLLVIETDARDALLAALAEQGIGAGIHYPVPLHLQPALRWLGYREGDFPHAEAAAKRVLSLPLYPELSDEQLAVVAAAVAGFFGRQARPVAVVAREGGA